MTKRRPVQGKIDHQEPRPVWRKGLCGVCPAGCWVEVALAANKLVNKLVYIRPDKSHTLGNICRRGQHAPRIVYSEHRLRYPLKRIGPKDSYEFERITWDAAYGVIADNLNSLKLESGAQAVAIYTGRGAQELPLCDMFQPKGVTVSSAFSIQHSASNILFPFGSPNSMGVRALCYVSLYMLAHI